jgi:tetratricopeptide (TPR) repeat protein
LEFKAGNYAKAIASYSVLAKVAANKKDLSAAWNGLMEANFLIGNYDSTQFYAQKVLNQGGVSAGAQNKATLFSGKAAMGKGDYDVAKDEFINTINTAKDEYSAEAKYLLAEIFFKTKEYKQCYETLVSLNSDFVSFTPWVGKSYLLLSDYYLAVGNRYQTKATLKSLSDFPLSDIKEAAFARLKALDAEDSKTKSTPKDSIDNK